MASLNADSSSSRSAVDVVGFSCSSASGSSFSSFSASGFVGDLGVSSFALSFVDLVDLSADAPPAAFFFFWRAATYREMSQSGSMGVNRSIATAWNASM
jgi:hypothetical protein